MASEQVKLSVHEEQEVEDEEEKEEALKDIEVKVENIQLTEQQVLQTNNPTQQQQQQQEHQPAIVFRSTWNAATIPNIVRTGSYIVVKRTKSSAQSEREFRILQYLMSRVNPYRDFFANLVTRRPHDHEYVDLVLQYGGTDLHNYFIADGNWDSSQEVVNQRITNTTRIIARAMCCLVKLHSLGLFHGDIKPENFVMDEITQQVRLIDFECCNTQQQQQQQQADGNSFCTLLYSHPRICAGLKVNGFKADMWSFGQMAYAMYIGNSLLNVESVAEKQVRQNAFLKSLQWENIYSQFIPKHIQQHPTFHLFVDFVDLMCAEYNPRRPLRADMMLLQHPFLCSWRENK